MSSKSSSVSVNGLASSINSLNKVKVPWEPYRAAIDTESNNKSAAYQASKLNQAAAQLQDASLSIHLNKDKLVRYKIGTNMESFNAKRPGFEFSEADFKQIDEKSVTADGVNEILVKNSIENAKKSLSTSLAQDIYLGRHSISYNSSNRSPNLKTLAYNKLAPCFIDARFYTDTQFLKLANQLKKNSLDTASTNSIKIGPKANAADVASVVSDNSSASSNKEAESAGCSREQCETRIAYLENQMKGIYEQLQIQTQVNVELKKMLVASIAGEDLQYKLERLISDKQRYEFELTSNSKEIQRLAEELEQMGIQCDLWRTKFSAVKLLSEENFAW